MEGIKKKGLSQQIMKYVIVIAMYVMGHVLFRPLLYVAALSTFALFAFDYKNIISLVLFFIPMARIMKFSPEAMTIFGLAVLLSLFILYLKNEMKMHGADLCICMFFFSLLLFKNIVGNFGFAFSYLRIVLLLLLLPQCLECYKKGYIDFDLQKAATVAFWGICVASFIGTIFADNRNFADYIATEDVYYFGEKIINRFCGLSSDPNYFSSLVLFALSMQLLCMNVTKRFVYMIYAVILSVLGILTLSKMFLLLLVILWCLGMAAIIKDKASSEKGQKNKYRMSLFIMVGITVVIGYSIGSGYFDIILSRFINTGSAGYTTGRTNIWIEYFAEIYNSIKIILIGISENSMMVGSRATHNTFIQIIWKTGLAGAIILFLWFFGLYYRTNSCLNNTKQIFEKTFIILFIQFLPLLALDKLFFDEFYWYYIVYLLCKINLSKVENVEKERIYAKNTDCRSDLCG